MIVAWLKRLLFGEPKPKGPPHRFRPWPRDPEDLAPNESWYELHVCLNCGQYISGRKAHDKLVPCTRLLAELA